jgi:hypothetical protein
VAAGRVHTVRLAGDLSAGESGFSLVEMHWHDRLFDRVSQVQQVSSDDVSSPNSGDSDRVVVGDLASHLSNVHPGLRVIREPDAVHHSVSSDIAMRWRVPAWIALINLLAWLTTLSVVINGPEPWRATRWAWFWISTDGVSTSLPSNDQDHECLRQGRSGRGTSRLRGEVRSL